MQCLGHCSALCSEHAFVPILILNKWLTTPTQSGGYVYLQAGCEHASDVLRPYSALDYAWDEPGLPHVLLVDLPGSHSLGRFNLDKVHHSCHLPLVLPLLAQIMTSWQYLTRCFAPFKSLQSSDPSLEWLYLQLDFCRLHGCVARWV